MKLQKEMLSARNPVVLGHCELFEVILVLYLRDAGNIEVSGKNSVIDNNKMLTKLYLIICLFNYLKQPKIFNSFIILLYF